MTSIVADINLPSPGNQNVKGKDVAREKKS